MHIAEDGAETDARRKMPTGAQAHGQILGPQAHGEILGTQAHGQATVVASPVVHGQATVVASHVVHVVHEIHGSDCDVACVRLF